MTERMNCCGISEAEAKAYLAEVKKNKKHNVLSKREAVLDNETAIALALVIWKSVYGTKQLQKQAPYQAIRFDDCWFVTGSVPKDCLGGSAKAVIRAADGCFLNVSHGK